MSIPTGARSVSSSSVAASRSGSPVAKGSANSKRDAVASLLRGVVSSRYDSL